MRRAVVVAVAQKEVRDALANRWFLLYAGGFALVALALARLALAGAAGAAGYGRTAASLVNLVLLLVPLLGLSLGAASLAGERERGTLAMLLAQPVTRLEVLAGKYLGLVLALAAALALGFGAAGLALALDAGAAGAGAFATLAGLAGLLVLVTVAFGLLISAVAPRLGAATGAALLAWLLLVFLGDLGLMGSALTMRLPPDALLALALANPLEAFRVGAIQAIAGSLDTLGPAGSFAARRFGDGLVMVLAGALALQAALGFGLAALAFQRRSLP
jgi:Cu-processing system permease protein